ncbi:MAG: lysophospholipid acyltransferase family protein [Syntrophales bacterium]|nr:lysophospholipid acyltransferase family protein [Syntrophales bacterium]
MTKLVVLFARLVPLEARKIIFRGLFRVFYVCSQKHRLITLSNLSHAFPDKTSQETASLARSVYRHLGTVIAEMLEIPFLTRENLSRYLYPEEFEKAGNSLKKGQGMILFTAHFGNWELLAAAWAILNRPIAVIYRPLDNRVLDDLVSWVRSHSTGNRLIPKDRAMRSILRSIRDGEIVGMLIDQNVAWQEGVFVEFFGRPACTTDGMALIASRSDAQLIPFFLARETSGKYRLIRGGEMELVRTDDKRKDAFINTQKATKVIEDVIRAYPDQWLWIHQRWKTKKLQAKGLVKDGSDFTLQSG